MEHGNLERGVRALTWWGRILLRRRERLRWQAAALWIQYGRFFWLQRRLTLTDARNLFHVRCACWIVDLWVYPLCKARIT
jgi:hypothetical protein